MSDTAEFVYKCTRFYDVTDEGGLMWNDPEIGVQWPVPEGAELIRTCTKQLDEAEQTVVKLQKGADGAPVETSFASENE